MDEYKILTNRRRKLISFAGFADGTKLTTPLPDELGKFSWKILSVYFEFFVHDPTIDPPNGRQSPDLSTAKFWGMPSINLRVNDTLIFDGWIPLNHEVNNLDYESQDIVRDVNITAHAFDWITNHDLYIVVHFFVETF